MPHDSNMVNELRPFQNMGHTGPRSRGANDASRVRVQLSSSRVVNISSRARARVELTRVEF